MKHLRLKRRDFIKGVCIGAIAVTVPFPEQAPHLTCGFLKAPAIRISSCLNMDILRSSTTDFFRSRCTRTTSSGIPAVVVEIKRKA